MRDRCNQINPAKYRHFILSEFLTPVVILKALLLYSEIALKGLQTQSFLPLFKFKNSLMNFYPIMRADWVSSLFGMVAMDGALFIAAFSAMISHFTLNAWGMFVWEGQPWEIALAAAWQQSQSSRLIAYQHSSLRPLDLRSFVNIPEHDSPSHAFPFPDFLIVNGQSAYNLMQTAHFPSTRLVLGEALRYLNLLQHLPRLSQTSNRRVLLIVTAYRATEVEYQFKLLAAANTRGVLDVFTEVWIKPHPFNAVDRLLKHLLPSFKYKIVSEPLSELWDQVDAAFVANSTTAVMEALYVGVPVAVCCVEDGMNLSPLYGNSSIPMIVDVNDLIEFLTTNSQIKWSPDFFLLDPYLPRWQALLTPSSN